jgi:hypothetical protein
MIFSFFALALFLGGWLVWTVRTPQEAGIPTAKDGPPGYQG